MWKIHGFSINWHYSTLLSRCSTPKSSSNHHNVVVKSPVSRRFSHAFPRVYQHFQIVFHSHVWTHRETIKNHHWISWFTMKSSLNSHEITIFWWFSHGFPMVSPSSMASGDDTLQRCAPSDSPRCVRWHLLYPQWTGSCCGAFRSTWGMGPGCPWRIQKVPLKTIWWLEGDVNAGLYSLYSLYTIVASSIYLDKWE